MEIVEALLLTEKWVREAEQQSSELNSVRGIRHTTRSSTKCMPSWKDRNEIKERPESCGVSRISHKVNFRLLLEVQVQLARVPVMEVQVQAVWFPNSVKYTPKYKISVLTNCLHLGIAHWTVNISDQEVGDNVKEENFAMILNVPIMLSSILYCITEL